MTVETTLTTMLDLRYLDDADREAIKQSLIRDGIFPEGLREDEIIDGFMPGLDDSDRAAIEAYRENSAEAGWEKLIRRRAARFVLDNMAARRFGRGN